MNREKMISDLHQYWLDLEKKEGDVGDIPGAVAYYRTLSLSELLAEWTEKCC